MMYEGVRGRVWEVERVRAPLIGRLTECVVVHD